MSDRSWLLYLEASSRSARFLCGVLLEQSPYAFIDQPSETALMSWLRHFSCDSRVPADCSPVDLSLHVPIVAMSVKVPVVPMLYIETSFEPEFVT